VCIDGTHIEPSVTIIIQADHIPKEEAKLFIIHVVEKNILESQVMMGEIKSGTKEKSLIKNLKV
jgi:hypothetical protein